MPPVPGKPDEYFFDLIKKMQADIKALQTSQQFVVTNQSGVVVMRTGLLPDGTNGIQLYDVNGQTVFKVDDIDGQKFPQASIMPAPDGQAYLSGTTANAFRPGTASATMFELWRADFSSVGSKIDYNLLVFANGGNMTWQIQCCENGGGTLTTVVGPTTETSNANRAGTFTIPTAGLLSGTDPVGRQITVRIQAQLNSGATTADVAVNIPFINHN